MGKAKGTAVAERGDVNVRTIKLSELRLDDENARVHGERNKDALKQSLERFGAARSIVIDQDGKVLAGNGTVEAAAAAGIEDAIIVETNGKQLVVVRRPDLTAEEAIAYALADNKTTDLSEWDYEKVAGQLRLLQEREPSLLDTTGFLAHEREPLLMASWSPPAMEPIPEDGRPEMGRPISVTKEQREVFDRACVRMRKKHGEDLSDGRCAELMAADFLAGPDVEE